ncbi:YnfC family lipoprotein [Pectobacterium polaris]|uniref:YnfC family lipoprotein n=1 Tax=Pectobacterium polaris TaxID=2042057 RepID=UPI0015829DC6|nr:YnfC family lipoprotein [Pectobacterium polaris]MCA6941580.1 YnfC family lipoprotein [Pectobacterium polaris]MCA6959247.1 YnfC family lipoprotein [Pectobacterium polaris]MCL6324992.1 YnfC family lipoprotein [Pectobacterium polaris]
MKFQIPILLSVFLLAGCFEDNKYSESNMKLFAILYAFEPIKGHVKETHLVVKGDGGNNFQDVLIKFDDKGCLANMEVAGKPVGMVSLKREKDKIVGTENNEKVVFDINEHCLILNKKTEGSRNVVVFSYDENGSIATIKNAKPGKDYHISYKPDGTESIIKVLMADKLADETKITFHDPINKPLDYLAMSDGFLLGESQTNMSCKYENKNPVSCDLAYRFIKENSVFKFHADINTVFY